MIEVRRTDEFAKWLKRLKDSDAKPRINLRIRRIALTGNLGDYKPAEDGATSHELTMDRATGCTSRNVGRKSYYYSHRGR